MNRVLFFLLFAYFFFFCFSLKGQVTIGSVQKARDGALLDLRENDNLDANSSRGLALPRVILDSLTITGGIRI